MPAYTWGDFLRAAMKYGVTRDRVESDELDEHGRPVEYIFLHRVVDGAPLDFDFTGRSLDEPIHWRAARNACIALRLPMDEFYRFQDRRG